MTLLQTALHFNCYFYVYCTITAIIRINGVVESNAFGPVSLMRSDGGMRRLSVARTVSVANWMMYTTRRRLVYSWQANANKIFTRRPAGYAVPCDEAKYRERPLVNEKTGLPAVADTGESVRSNYRYLPLQNAENVTYLYFALGIAKRNVL